MVRTTPSKRIVPWVPIEINKRVCFHIARL